MRWPLLTALVAAMLTSVGHGQSPANRPVWPSPPAPARIRFIRTLDPASVRGRPSLFSRFLTIVAGRRDEPQMSQPYGIAVAVDRRVYVADTAGSVVHVYSGDGSDYSSIKVDAQSLIGIGVSDKRLFVTDSTGGRLLCLDLKGHVLWALGRDAGFARPTGIAVGPDRLYVVDTLRHQVVMVAKGGQVLGSFGTRGAEPGQFNFPTNIARDRNGRLFVTDSMNFRVQVFDENGRVRGTFGRVGDGSGDFDKPKGIAIDSAGHIYVVEGMNDVVQIFDDEGRLLLTFGGSGTGDGQLWLPSGIAIANDVVYVADSANRRVQVFEYLEGPR